MIKVRWLPPHFCMAQGTIRWKVNIQVVRVRRLGVIVCVTACASVWRIAVVPVVAGCAIIGNQRMRPKQGIIITMRRKGRR